MRVRRNNQTQLRHDFYQARCVKVAGKKIAIATFRGEAAATHELIHIFSAMEDALIKLLELEHPVALALDFRELKYSWGDEMARTLSVPSDWFGGEFPIAVVTSELNHAGLASLVREEMFSDPVEWLTNTEEAAIALIESKFAK